VEEARRAVEVAARDSYGRLLAWLAARSRDVAAAEDALADAFAAALENWSKTGIPVRPEAWLLVAARRRLIDAARHARVRGEAVPTLLAITEDAEAAAESVTFPDERLKLLFVCAHPAIAEADRTPLMLQTVLGLDAARIGSAFLVRPVAMGQRLSRAKAKIRLAKIRFDLPEPGDLPPRLAAVLDSIYAAYGSGWEAVAGADSRRKGLSAEAIHLGRTLVTLLPDQAEPLGLLALMLHCEARRDARRARDGAFVPLSNQDSARWSVPMIAEAEAALAAASRLGRIGRFQLEAAIQSAHAQAGLSGATDWDGISVLYEGLVRVAPTVGALLGRAAAVAEARGADAGWALFQALPSESLAGHQPYWALAAHLLTRLGRSEEARAAYGRAIGLCEDPAMRAFLAARMG
jgi:RNA polymerase sigma-70 factor (ECF subfamily)